MSGSSAQNSRRHTFNIILAFAIIYIIWGTTYLGIRIAVETIPPFLMAGTRFFISGALLFIILRLRGEALPKRLYWRTAAIVGAFLVAGGPGLVTWSEQQVPSSTAALVVATVPLWMALFEWLIFKGLRPGRRATIGLVLGFIGIALLIGPGQILGTAGFSLFAMLVLLCAPVLWSLGSLYSREANLPENTFMSTAMQMLTGGSLLLLASLITGEPARFDFTAFSTRSLAAMAYLLLFGTIIAFPAYIWLLKNVASTKVSTYTYVNPVIAVFLGWLILSEPVTATMIAAMVIIILAVILITTSKPAAKESVEPPTNPALLAAEPPEI